MAMRIIGSPLECKNGHQHKTITRSPVFLWDVDLRSKYGGKYDPSYCKNHFRHIGLDACIHAF